MNVRETLAKNLAYYRKRAGLNQSDAAEKLGTKKTTLASWEQMKSQPNADMLVAIAMLYKATLSELCGTDYDLKITSEEKDLIKAYRLHPRHRDAVRVLLEMDDKGKNSGLQKKEA